MLKLFFFSLSFSSLLTPLVGEEDTEGEGVMVEVEEDTEEEEVMVEEEGVMGEEVGVMVEVEAMEGAGVAIFKAHKDSLHQALASPPVQGYVCLCVQLCVSPLSVCMRHCALSLTAAGRQTAVANPRHISPDPVGY